MIIICILTGLLMYIKTDYKDEYLNYIDSANYSANTVRNLRSDLNSLYIWLQAYNFQVTIANLYGEYQRYLIANGTSLNTMNRKLSSLTRFLRWLNMQHPTSFPVTPFQSSSNRREALNYSQHRVTSRSYIFRYIRFFLGLLVFICLIIGIVLLFRLIKFPLTAKKAEFSDVASSNREYILQFDLQFNSLFSPSNRSNTTIAFRFYLQKDQIHSIGYVLCPIKDTYSVGGSSRLKVRLDSNCSPLPPLVHDAIGRNEAISTDIFLNDKKMTINKISINTQNLVNHDLNYQGEIIDTLSKDSNLDGILPNSIEEGNVLGLGTASSSATLGESIPLSVFSNVTRLDDGDIVTIYNNEIIRALLSTRIFGVKSSDHIITQGIAYVHVVNTPGITISEGDYVSTSTIPGYGQKAINKYDSVVGVALESYIPGNSYLKVLLSSH